MNEQIPFAYSTTKRLKHGGLYLGVQRPVADAQPVFEAVEWNEESLAELSASIASLRYPAFARAHTISFFAGLEWRVTAREIFSKQKFREAVDARVTTATVLHHLFPGEKDRLVAGAFGRTRTWAIHAYRSAADLCETSPAFREKFERVLLQAQDAFWPEAKEETATADSHLSP